MSERKPIGEPIKAERGDEFLARIKREAGGRPIQIITNPVNPDGSLTPEAQAAVDAIKKREQQSDE